MLSRVRDLNLSGRPLSGPLLVPSISSKGFPEVDGVSEAAHVLDLAGPDIQEALLISAYDLHHEHLRDRDRLLGKSWAETTYATPSLLILDSGGYELADDYESGEVRRSPRTPSAFSESDLRAIVSRLSRDMDALVVSYDSPQDERGSYSDQRARAQAFFSDFPYFKSNFLVKPEPDDDYLDSSKLAVEAGNLRDFDVIGVTEKELGRTLLERLVLLGRIRRDLDDRGVHAPIHVFGSLDPLLTPLYFMLGGEIFDGLSWIRYSYNEGVAMHQDAPAVLLNNLDDDPVRRDARRQLSNIAELRKIKHNLERWHGEPERFEHLGQRHEELRVVFETAMARLRRRD